MRDVILDFRYDGEGWFEIWADEHLLYTATEFAQGELAVPVPGSAQTLRFVLGALPETGRDHELTLFDLVLSPPRAENVPSESSCQENEVQFLDVDEVSYCLQSDCTTNEDCGVGECLFEESLGVNLCVQSCADAMECGEGQECVWASAEEALCVFR